MESLGHKIYYVVLKGKTLKTELFSVASNVWFILSRMYFSVLLNQSFIDLKFYSCLRFWLDCSLASVCSISHWKNNLEMWNDNAEMWSKGTLSFTGHSSFHICLHWMNELMKEWLVVDKGWVCYRGWNSGLFHRVLELLFAGMKFADNEKRE